MLNRRLLALVLTLFVVTLAMTGCIAGGTTNTTTMSPSTTRSFTNPAINPVAILSVTGPMPPYNPGGPTVKLTVENSSDEPVVSLKAVLELERSYECDFGLSTTSPLAPGKTVSASLTLINAGISSDATYPVKVSGTLANGQDFTFTESVVIAVPAH